MKIPLEAKLWKSKNHYVIKLPPELNPVLQGRKKIRIILEIDENSVRKL